MICTAKKGNGLNLTCDKQQHRLEAALPARCIRSLAYAGTCVAAVSVCKIDMRV